MQNKYAAVSAILLNSLSVAFSDVVSIFQTHTRRAETHFSLDNVILSSRNYFSL